MNRNFSSAELQAIESSTRDIGLEIYERALALQPSVFERRWWDDRIMAWAMQDDSVKLQAFRFVDVLPMLRTSEAVTRHLQEYFQEVDRHLPAAVRLGLGAARPNSIAGRALALAARRNALAQARRFIAGTSADEVLSAAQRERRLGRSFTLDLLGEAVISEPEADAYLRSYLDLIERMAPAVNAWPAQARIDQSAYGELPRVNVSVKLSALDSQFDPIDPAGTARRVGARLRELLRVARNHRAYVHVDMESYHAKDLTLRIFQEVLAEPEFRETVDVGIVIQCYLREAEADLVALRDWARERGAPVWVRLVKGAYWDYETVHAAAEGWPTPVYTRKWQSDACFERCTRFLIANRELLRPALGSHNIRSLAHGIAVARHLGLAEGSIELQMLYGMGDSEKHVLVDMGLPLRVYMPFGELIPGMAYLVRRLLENTSNDSFLRAGFSEQVSTDVLLADPASAADTEKDEDAMSYRPPTNPRYPQAYANEPTADFARRANREAMSAAIAEVQHRCGRHEPLWIAGRAVDTRERITSLNPSHKSQVVGTTASAGDKEVALAVAAAKAAQPGWHRLGVERRAEYLRRAAEVLRERRFQLAAWEILECGKGWREADADVCEAIDFLSYYADQAVEMQGPQGVDVPGEENRFYYAPRGVAAVIAPWNFPLAILTGMTAAALVTGNTVVMKPSEQSPIVAARLVEIFREVGLPDGVLNYLPGSGEVAGAALGDHPDTAIIAFTGSRAVGLHIERRTAELAAEGKAPLKRVIAEMGGKNAIIVDDDADLDEAVQGVVRSALGYQGQKCSACSRAIVLDTVYDAFVPRLVEATRSVRIGPAEDPSNTMGPVIDEDSFNRIHSYIKIGLSEAKLALSVDASTLTDEGFYIGPHIFTEVPPSARIAQEEIFGPVLAVLRAKDLDDAFRIANSTQYGLTGGIFSRSPAHLDRARDELEVGNLYLNRAITGALVGRQPFGGFKFSGIGSKAGGPDYLLQFVVPRTVTENTLRRGFAASSVGEEEGGE